MKAKLAAMMSSENMTWGTPRPFYGWINKAFGFSLDVCASKSNTKCNRFFTEADNGLAQSWAGEVCWMNPPYGDWLRLWLEKARRECIARLATTAALIPSRTDTEWWRDLVMQRDGVAGGLRRSWYEEHSGVLWLTFQRMTVGVYHHEGRLTFEGAKDTAPFPSSVIIYDPPLSSRREWSGWQRESRARPRRIEFGVAPLNLGREAA